jgi:SAM-dependent methyltransferase
MHEISDLIVDYDATTLARRPVQKADVVARLVADGNRRAERIAARLPERRGVLDEDEIDRVLVRSHIELQRLHEEFMNARRMRAVLALVLSAVRASRRAERIRVVDIGCGLGYVVRWLAAYGALGDDVDLVGVDYNAALVRAAARLAEGEGLRCTFARANAFRLDAPATVYTSIGVLHHFRGDDLVRVFREQADSPALGMIHFDIRPWWGAPLGAWIFHQARMREPLARHDGYLSAVRAHPASVLVEATRRGAPDFDLALLDGRASLLSIMHAVVGVRPTLREGFRAARAPLEQRFEDRS